jgi:CRP-like cAMP-binding protein
MLETLSSNTFNAPSQSLRLNRKQSLFHPGDRSQSIFRVQKGLIRITKMTPEGRTLTIRHLEPGDFFGEEALNDENRVDLAEALTSAQIEAIDPSLINGSDLMMITRSLSTQMKRLMDYEYHLQTGELRERVARYLVQLANTPLATPNEKGQIMISATHELLAEGTASTRESVSKIISELRFDGLIDSGYRNIIILNKEELEMIAEGF